MHKPARKISLLRDLRARFEINLHLAAWPNRRALLALVFVRELDRRELELPSGVSHLILRDVARNVSDVSQKQSRHVRHAVNSTPYSYK